MKKRIMASAIAIAVGIGLAGCGASSTSSGEDDGTSAESGVIRAGLLPNAETAGIRLGEKNGVFADHGIDLQITDTSSGAASITALVAGQFDVVFANSVSVMQGRDKGIPLVMVAAASTSSGVQGEDFSALVVGSDSKLKGADELAGKTVATNTLKNIGEVTARMSIQKAGGDDSQVNFVELPFANMEQALEEHQIDAAWMVEPFHTTAVNDGLRDLTSNYVDAAPGLTAATFVTTEKVIKEKPELIQKFKEAVTEAGNYANDNPDEIRELIPTFTKVSPGIANQFVIPLYDPEVNTESLQAMLPEMEKLDMISDDFDVDSVIYKP